MVEVMTRDISFSFIMIYISTISGTGHKYGIGSSTKQIHLCHDGKKYITTLIGLKLWLLVTLLDSSLMKCTFG